MPNSGIYNGNLTQEQFLFTETRIVAKLINDGLSKEEIIKQISYENLFQFPTERKISIIANGCIKRVNALNQPMLIEALATAPVDIAKQINLYAMMRYNRIMWEFFVLVVGEKYRTQDFSFSKRDLNTFFTHMEEQDENVAKWTERTKNEIQGVILRSMIQCGYINDRDSETLNPVYLYPELEEGMRANNDTAAFVAFNYFG